MTNFKKVLETEKKYQQIINNTNKSIEKKKHIFYSNLKLKEEATKLDFQKELNNDFVKKIDNLKIEAKKIIENSKNESLNLLQNSNIEKAKQLLMEEIKNV